MNPTACDLPGLLHRQREGRLSRLETRVRSGGFAEDWALAGDRVGQRIGTFAISGRLGRGGMGVVYAGQHVVSGLEVAIKLTHSWLMHDAGVVARLHLEALATARIRHPGVVRVRDLGVDHGQTFLVSERLRGMTVAERARGGPLSVAETVEIGRQIAASMSAAHAAGVVHCDLKPDNVFLAIGACGPPRVKIFDFGLARVSGCPSWVNTIDDQGAGTPLYMSPEQWTGDVPVSESSDVYALGCMLFELVTGHPPFVGSELLVQDGHLHVPPVRARTRAPWVPVRLSEFIARMMSKRPCERPGSMREVEHELSLFGVAHGSSPRLSLGSAAPG